MDRISKPIRILSVILSALALSGCMTYGAIENRGTNINEGVGAMQNRAMLLNLVRASRHEPLYFTSVNQVQALGQTDFKLGAPTIPTGPGLSAAQRALSWNGNASTFLDNTSNTSLQLGVYSTQSFYEGLLKPLDLTDIYVLLRQGFSRELIFYLVIDSIKLTPAAGGDPIIVRNEPSDSETYPIFEQAVSSAMEHGLTTEVEAESVASTPPDNLADQTEMGMSRAHGDKSATPNGGASSGQGDSNSAISIQSAPPPTPELCFEKAFATLDARAEFEQRIASGKRPLFCGENAVVSDNHELTLSINNQEWRVEVTTRSIYGIFRYLGDVMTDSPQMAAYQLPSATKPSPWAPKSLLIRMTNADQLGFDCFTAVKYEGRSYCVPIDGAGTDNTKDIFNILSMLVALKQSPGDLPATATVLVAP